jgi:hypothetical protein
VRASTAQAAHPPHAPEVVTQQPLIRKATLNAHMDPEVLVPAGERRALMQFIALVHCDGIAPDALNAVNQPLAPLAALPAIHMDSIEIAPLDLPASPGT